MKTWESQTWESRRVEATNAGFKTRFKLGHEKNINADVSSALC